MSLASVLDQGVSNFGIVVMNMLATRPSLILDLVSPPTNLCDNFRLLTIEFPPHLADRFALCQVLRRTGLDAI